MQQVTNEDGSVSTIAVPQNQTGFCPHNAEFMTQPGIEAIIEQQRAEIAAAQALLQQQAAEAAAIAAGQQPPASPPDDGNGVPAQ